MKILLAHNIHRSGAPSGDDSVFNNEIALLKRNGHNVIIYKRSNDELFNASLIKKIPMWIQSIWSLKTYWDIKKIIREEKPDIAHFHNIFPLISPSAYYACYKMVIPVVQTLHDFRFLCPIAFFFRDGHICEECARDSLWKSIKYRCFKNSRFQSAIASFILWFHKMLGTWGKKVSMYICLTESAYKKFVEFGFPENRITVKPNFLSINPDNFADNGNYVIFVGRLSYEKGVQVLLEAWKAIEDIPLKIIGDGPQRDEFKNLAESLRLKNIEFLGMQTHSETIKLLQNARFMLMPSVCYESFPLTIGEAFACGKPVITSNLGAMADIVEDGKTGLLFKPGDSEELAEKVRWLWNHPDECRRMGENARREYEKTYTPEKNYQMLMDIYEKVLTTNRKRK